MLAKNPVRVDLRVLSEFPELDELRARKVVLDSPPLPDDGASETPEEMLATAGAQLRSALLAELFELVGGQSPEFFERLVVDLLVQMGYGGRREDAARHLGRSGDEGVDGVIQEDRLGLDEVYVQANRWADVVERPEIQKFVGALQGRRATKGVFITTSNFSTEAIDYAATVTPWIILIDGIRLADLMIDDGVGVGVVVEQRYGVKRADRDYFSPEDDAGL